ncbi:MAG: M23 family metallopeptidase, partial [Anaerolineae bacterium]|nr:M23 family metallopeptidase [Anaerolineae bacterium]
EYGLPSTRFDARYHAGDDWYGARGQTYGQPVQAIARGRVTYSAPWGWGRDKGVVIIEHAMPDGSTWYSLYGHMEEVGGVTFPALYSCVELGQVIGAVGHPRPAPHLHLEIRNFWPDTPGPGYYPVDPAVAGWTDPSRFIAEWRARLSGEAALPAECCA